MREIPLTKGYVALVDDEDYARCVRIEWRAYVEKRADGSIKNVYAYRRGRGNTLALHRFILGVDDREIQVDHRDRNGLNCRRGNLRAATESQNQANRGPQRNNTSGFKGVTRRAKETKYIAQIKIDGKQRHLGRHVTPQEAACAVDAAAVELFGEFAHLNFAPAC
jgi:hypothetical protein